MIPLGNILVRLGLFTSPFYCCEYQIFGFLLIFNRNNRTDVDLMQTFTPELTHLSCEWGKKWTATRVQCSCVCPCVYVRVSEQDRSVLYMKYKWSYIDISILLYHPLVVMMYNASTGVWDVVQYCYNVMQRRWFYVCLRWIYKYKYIYIHTFALMAYLCYRYQQVKDGR